MIMILEVVDARTTGSHSALQGFFGMKHQCQTAKDVEQDLKERTYRQDRFGENDFRPSTIPSEQAVRERWRRSIRGL